MRPTLLKFGGIGAYPGHVEVDFEELSKKGLYLVIGPTGAGKTTIFDAMTFALYGKTAGNREGMFVSDHDNRVDPYTELHFSHQDRHFIVHREPAKEKGKNPPPTKQWFREVDEDGQTIRTETGIRNITEQVTELLGLDAEQFMQVILLPQNKFQKFLMANSTERKPLLQKIFGTGLYARVAEHLKNSAKEMKEDADKTQQKINVALGTAHQTLSQLHEESYFDKLNVSTPEDIDIACSISVLTAERNTITAENLELTKKHTEAVEAATRATEEAERFDAAVEKQQLVEIQDTHEKTIQEAKKQLEDSERAQRVVEISTSADSLALSAKTSREHATQLRDDLATSLGALTLNLSSTATLLSAIPTARPKTLSSEVSAIHKNVEDVLKAIHENSELSKGITELEENISSKQKAVDDAGKELAALTSTLENKKSEAKDALTADKNLPKLEQKISDLNDLLQEADVDGAVDILTQATTELEKAQSAFTDADARLSQARLSRTLHLAGELAAALVKDEECPVCGSTHHPKKAKKTTETDISKLETKRDKAQEKKLQAEGVVAEAQAAVTKAKAAAKKLPSPADQDALRKDFEEMSVKAAQSNVLNDEVREIEELIEKLKEKSKGNELQIKEDNGALQQKRARHAVVEPLAKSLGAENVVSDASNILSAAIEILDDLDKAESLALTDEARSKEAAKQVASVLKTEKFTSVDAAQAALLDDETRITLADSITEHQRRAERILVLSGRIGDTPLPKERPALEDLQDAVQTALELKDASATSLTTTSNAITSLEDVQKKLGKLGPEAQEKVQRADAALALAKVVDKGAGSGENLQLGLEEWVQRTLFEEVCLVATTQLQKLSNNRYFLTLEPEGAKMKKKAGGLELYVLDSHNGKTRSVQTLSGGEQFLTSLALALALAEVVERHAGGMQLSTLFIDEGFGSLDSETLEQATSVLTKLQDIGRTVGLITHVELMQERLPIGIRINKTNSGSTLELVD